MKSLWRARELSTLAILVVEVLFFAWYLWPDAGRTHPFLNAENALLILKYSSIYGIAAVGAAVVIISGGIDLAPGAVIALASVVTGHLVVEAGVGLGPGIAAGMLVGGVTGPADGAAHRKDRTAAVHRHARHDGHCPRPGVYHHRGTGTSTCRASWCPDGVRSACRPTGWRRS